MIRRSAAERRKSLRARRVMSVSHRLFKRNSTKINNPWHLSATQDMCAGGLLFGSNVPYQVNDIVELQVVMAGVLDIFNGFGRVVRVDKKSLGAFYLVAVCLESAQKTKNSGKKKITRRAASYI